MHTQNDDDDGDDDAAAAMVVVYLICKRALRSYGSNVWIVLRCVIENTRARECEPNVFVCVCVCSFVRSEGRIY